MSMSGYYNIGVGSDAESIRAIHRALELGVTHLDTAEIYGPYTNEELVGRAIRDRRDQVVLATKFGLPMPGARPDEARGSRRYVHQAVRASLRRLRTDWIDLYQLHVPDPSTPIEETLGALDDLVHQGLVRYVGCSQFAAWQVADAAWTARTAGLTPFVSAQYEYSLLRRAPEAELVPACTAHGVGTLPFFPLANGLLTGKYHRDQPLPTGTRLGDEPDRAAWVATSDALDRVEALRSVADAAGASMAELAIGWLAAQPTVASVIAGASTPTQVEANAAAASVVLDAELRDALDRAAPGPT
jgi:aryl-alcohol dehydrogenase-like predicted oxidoreductase